MKFPNSIHEQEFDNQDQVSFQAYPYDEPKVVTIIGQQLGICGYGEGLAGTEDLRRFYLIAGDNVPRFSSCSPQNIVESKYFKLNKD